MRWAVVYYVHLRSRMDLAVMEPDKWLSPGTVELCAWFGVPWLFRSVAGRLMDLLEDRTFPCPGIPLVDAGRCQALRFIARAFPIPPGGRPWSQMRGMRRWNLCGVAGRLGEFVTTGRRVAWLGAKKAGLDWGGCEVMDEAGLLFDDPAAVGAMRRLHKESGVFPRSFGHIPKSYSLERSGVAGGGPASLYERKTLARITLCLVEVRHGMTRYFFTDGGRLLTTKER